MKNASLIKLNPNVPLDNQDLLPADLLLQLRRGLASELPTLAEGEMFFALDTHALYLKPTSGAPVSTVIGAAGGSTLAGDTDVSITTPANNDVLTYDTASTKWKNKAAAGGIAAGSHILPFGDLTAASGNLGTDQTVSMKVPAGLVMFQAAKFKIALRQNSYAADYSGVVILRTLPGSATVIDSTPITFGGLAAFTAAAATTTYSDAITLAIDTAHDYYILAHIAGTSVHGIVGQTASPPFTLLCAPFYSDSGDQTGQTTISLTPASAAVLFADFCTA